MLSINTNLAIISVQFKKILLINLQTNLCLMVEQKLGFDDDRVLNGVYERLEEVGYGTFATVYKCRALSLEPL